MSYSAWRQSALKQPRQMIVTAPLKSYVEQINSRETMKEELYFAFCHQYMLDRRTSPYELDEWRQQELETVIIDQENIVSLYYLNSQDEFPYFNSWELCCSVMYGAQIFYVHMYANCEYNINCAGGGCITITRHPKFYLRKIVTSVPASQAVFKALKQEGLEVEIPDPFTKIHPKCWRDVPALEYLCHLAIFRHRKALRQDLDQLPPVMKTSVDRFIKESEWENNIQIESCEHTWSHKN